MINFFLGATAGTVAATVCYPLDTVRRRMQMKGHVYDGQYHAMKTILQKVGAGSPFHVPLRTVPSP